MKKIVKTSIIFMLIIVMANISYASGIIDQIEEPKINPELANMLGGVIGVIQIVGTGVAVGASIYLGIKYILSSTEEKADIKKKLVPFVIGVIIFYGATGILQIIANFSTIFPTR